MLSQTRGAALAPRRAHGFMARTVPGVQIKGSRLVARADASELSEAAQAAIDKASAAAADAAAKAKVVAQEKAAVAVDKAKETASKLKSAVNQASLDVDLSQILGLNFVAQLGLTGVAWAVVFLNSHLTIAKGGAALNPISLVLLVGVALAGYSTYLSYTYLKKGKAEGVASLTGFSQLNAFYEHAIFNFAGAATALLALFANIGILMIRDKASFALESLAQAASNTLLAHVVSLAFLTIATRKITTAFAGAFKK